MIRVQSKPIWIETAEGLYLPSASYDNNISEEDGQALCEIEWRKLKLTKKNLSKVRLEILKPSDFAYHKDFGYLQLERLIGTLHGQTPKDGEKEMPLQWECRVVTDQKD